MVHVDQVRWLSVADVATYFQVHPNTIHRWVNAGRLPNRRSPSGRLMFTQGDLDESVKHGGP